MGPGEENKVCNSLNFLCRFSCITFYDLLALAITIIWLVIGSTWTLNVYDEVNYDSKSAATYCPKYLYRFTFYTIIAGWVFVVLALVFGTLFVADHARKLKQIKSKTLPF